LATALTDMFDSMGGSECPASGVRQDAGLVL